MKKYVTLAIVIILYIIYFGAIIAKSDFWGNLLSPIATLILAFAVHYGYRQKEKNKIYRMAGLFLFLSLFTWFLFDVSWTITDLVLNKDPELNYIIVYGYGLTNLFLLLSMVLAAYQELKKWNGMQVLLDTIAFSCCTMMFVWIIFFNQDMKNAVLMKKDWIAMLIVFIDFLICVWLNIWFFSIKRKRTPFFVYILTTGLFIFTIADLIFYYEYFYTDYDPNSLLDGLYMGSFIFFGVSAILKVRTQKKSEDNADNILRSVGKGKSIFLIVFPFILLLFKDINIEYLLILISISMFYFVFSSYIQKNIYRDEMLKREKNLNVELENMVIERTKELHELLIRDVVTGLHSRRYFMEQLDIKINTLTEQNTILLFYIDLNKFKLVKTMYGNYIGDKVLVAVGKRLREYSNIEKDILASYGEDVFVLAKYGQYTYKDGLEIAERIMESTSDIYHIEEYDIRVTINIGISIYPLDAIDRGELIKHADIAMSQVRSKGFNKAMAFDKDLGDVIDAKNKIEMLLKNAQCNEEFHLQFQPQVTAEDGSLIGFEALIRWITKSGTFIPPGDFISIAEETGFIIPIGYWVMQTAIEQLALWDSLTTKRLRMAINVSVKQLSDRNFISRLYELLDKYKILPERIELEITESIQLEESIEIKESLMKIKNIGISIAIDDFGTGYSSLYYLKNLPISRIKIAKQLVDKIHEDTYDYTIAKTVITIAKVRGIHVIAEGVETKIQWDCLKKLKCNELQGYYFAKPMRAQEAFEKWLNEGDR